MAVPSIGHVISNNFDPKSLYNGSDDTSDAFEATLRDILQKERERQDYLSKKLLTEQNNQEKWEKIAEDTEHALKHSEEKHRSLDATVEKQSQKRMREGQAHETRTETSQNSIASIEKHSPAHNVGDSS